VAPLVMTQVANGTGVGKRERESTDLHVLHVDKSRLVSTYAAGREPRQLSGDVVEHVVGCDE
jgi:hypothetical protein